MRKVLILASIVILCFFLSACTGEKKLTREEWEALSTNVNSSASSIDSTSDASTSSKVTSGNNITSVNTKKTSLKTAPSTKNQISYTTVDVTTLPPPAKTTVPTSSYEEEYANLTKAFEKTLLQNLQEIETLKAERDQIVMSQIQTENRINQDIISLERQKDSEIAQLLANSGGYESSAVKAARKHYDSLIESKKRDLSTAKQESQNKYSAKTAEMEAVQDKTKEQERQYNEAVASLKRQYGLA